MLNSLINSALHNRFMVLMGTLLIAGLGVYSAIHLPIDAVPDLTNIQVQVITEAPALSPLEVETLLSFPVEGAMSGLPNVEQIRSISKFGISVVTIVFHEGTDIYRARQLVGERLTRAAEAIPNGYGKPSLGPITTALGEVYQFQVKAAKGSGVTAMELRTILDWFIAFQLRGVPGVTEINSHGGELKTFQVELDPDKLATYHLAMTNVFNALRDNNANVGGGYLVHEGEARYIRGESQAHSVADIAAIVIDERNGVPVTIADVAKVHPAPMIRAGLATRDGEGEIVTGLVMMMIGENSRTVVERVKHEIGKLQKSLPPGVTIEPLYDRTHLIDQTLDTVVHNLVEGGALVILILLGLLGNIRGGLIVALAIPLSMLFAANVMLATGVTASLMSLGAIDFGLIVDSSVIMIENCVRRLAHEGGTRPKLEIIRDAAVEVRKPTMFGELIIAIVYLPILALQGTEGKLFRPMALTVIFALAGSMVLSLTLMPVLASLCLSSKAEEKEVWLVRLLKRAYVPALDMVIRRPVIATLLALGLVLVSVPVARQLGGEFMPRLNEGDLLIEAVRIPSASLEGAVTASTQIENIVKKFPEVRMVYSKTGRPEIANDVMGVHQTDVWTMLKPQSEWRPGLTRDALIQEMDKELNENVPGVKFGFSQPIEMRVNELVAGVKSDVAVLLYGLDLDVLRRKAEEIERTLARIPGAKDIKTPTSGRLPMLRVSVRRDQLARYGIKGADVMEAIAALGGTTVGTAFEGQYRRPIQVRLPEAWRNSPEKIGAIRIVDPLGRPIALHDLADLSFEEGPSEVERENVQRRAVVGVNVRGRDIAGFVAEAQAAIDAKVALAPGYFLRWGGQFEHLQTATQRLMIVVPIALALIFLLLFSTFHSLRLAALIYLAVPMAATGGIFALAARGLPFSISAGVGFIALFGVAVLNGLVWVSAVEQLRLEGVEPHEAAREAAVVRLRPIMMTALVAGFGFIPMALSTTPGAEIQRPLATVVIGGLLTSTLLTTLVLPAIYPWFVPELPKKTEL
ncbi:efflux RND transporter permease subunit [Singulisphaera acidiphila]|uniref:Heavy metal efflux pump, cobalt-zinc-cadmium n=1 Tax=Singulisphaera acidiphila (strain ATCC BAA-1392 / DSM 18658 / VKM B-2454 / MOB10) TaxID=886293 RepID=L0DSP2_SINAD|nr:CusA/CzcA family heavy metal efflux RND transporter [Singulisphaera acidiphila]AGA31381.1 heavy metal efflux pump, cobalt-zinc-cadmium [Singulisphaera acidiphila DSM 18658]